MSERTTISNGIRWVRYLLIPIMLELLISIIQNSETRQQNIILIVVCGLFYFALFKMKRVRFDDENIYRIYGKKEKAVAFSSVLRIEKSGVKRNNRKMWRMRYLDADGKEKKFLFLDGIFQSGSVGELIEKVKAVNSAVEIEESYVWNQVEQQKRRKAKRKAKKQAREEGKN